MLATLLKLKLILISLLALLSLHSQPIKLPPAVGGSISPPTTTDSPMTTSFFSSRSSSTYAGTFSFTCSDKVVSSIGTYSRTYFSSVNNDKDFVLTAYSNTDPNIAFRNLVCKNDPTISCWDGQGNNIIIPHC